MIPKKYVEQADIKLASQDVPLYDRPMSVVMMWMAENDIEDDVLAPEIWRPLRKVYARLYPNGDFAMPPMLEGGVGFRDQIYKVRANIGFGTFNIRLTDYIEITEEELLLIQQNHPTQFWHAHYVVSDIWDFAYGVSNLKRENNPAAELFNNAASFITSAARSLATPGNASAAIQSSCLAAELALKGSLTHIGVGKDELCKMGHNLTALAQTLIKERSTESDSVLSHACAKFPKYAPIRYQPHGMNRFQLIDLCHRGQFVAADSIRRITGRDIGAQVENNPTIPPRAKW